MTLRLTWVGQQLLFKIKIHELHSIARDSQSGLGSGLFRARHEEDFAADSVSRLRPLSFRVTSVRRTTAMRREIPRVTRL